MPLQFLLGHPRLVGDLVFLSLRCACPVPPAPGVSGREFS